MCYIITMTVWVKLAVLDSFLIRVIYLVSGNLFFTWCLFPINSFNMGGYGVKITVISSVIVEHLRGLSRKRVSFISGSSKCSCFSDCFSQRVWLFSETWPSLCCHLNPSELKAVKEAGLSGGTGIRLRREWLSEALGKWCLESSTTTERLEVKPQANAEESVRGALHHTVFLWPFKSKVFWY